MKLYTLLSRTSGDGFWRVESFDQPLEEIYDTMDHLRMYCGVKECDMRIVTDAVTASKYVKEE
jgi:hypothetical protein